MGKIEALESITLEQDSNENIFSQLFEKAVSLNNEKDRPRQFDHPIVTQLVGFDINDQPVVKINMKDCEELIVARATVPLVQKHKGASVVVLFENADPYKPIVMGVIQNDISQPFEQENFPHALEVKADDQQLLLTAEKEIVMRCGEASITLTRAGKVIIKGNYILSRASGYNKIKGAAVDIN